MEGKLTHLAAVCGVLVLLVGVMASLHVSPDRTLPAQVFVYDEVEEYVHIDQSANVFLGGIGSDTIYYQGEPQRDVEHRASTNPAHVLYEKVQTGEDELVVDGIDSIDGSMDLYVEEYVYCPFDDRDTLIVVDFTEGGSRSLDELLLVADGKKADATHVLDDVLILPGTYEIRLASYDTHLYDLHNEYAEQWLLEFYGEGGTSLGTTNATRDLADDETLAQERVETAFVLEERTFGVMARHAAYKSSEPHSFAPLCAALKLVERAKSGVVSQSVAVHADSTSTIDMPYPTCPFEEKEGRVLVDFTKGGMRTVQELTAVADRTKEEAIVAAELIELPRGTYTVRLASYGGVWYDIVSEYQTWYISLLDEDETEQGRTPVSRDVPSWADEFVSIADKQFAVTGDVTQVAGIHGAYPATSSSPVAMLCAAFDHLKEGDVLPREVQVEDNVVPTYEPVVAAWSAGANAPETTLTVLEKDALQGVELVEEKPAARTLEPHQRGILAINPASIGLTSGLREVMVEYEVVEARNELARATGTRDIFTALASAPPSERKELVKRLYAFSTSSTATGTTVMSMKRVPTLVRTSDEDVVSVPEIVTPERAQQQQYVVDRKGIVSIRDTDGDGVTDYDEEHLYGTDPDDPFTSGSVLSDGERLLLGLDPTTDDMETVTVESPKQSGTTFTSLFTIETVEVVSQEQKENDLKDTDVTTPFFVAGTTRPFTFVTIYLYSTPVIATVRADESGKFKYTFDETLPEGSHELYVASVNARGKILAKSEVVSFEKTAQTITLASTVSDTNKPVAHNSFAFSLLVMLLLVIATAVSLGFVKSHHPHPAANQVHLVREG